MGLVRARTLLALLVALASGSVPWRTCVPSDGSSGGLVLASSHVGVCHLHASCGDHAAVVGAAVVGLGRQRLGTPIGNAALRGSDGDSCCSDIPIDVGTEVITVGLEGHASAGTLPGTVLARTSARIPAATVRQVSRERDRVVLLL